MEERNKELDSNIILASKNEIEQLKKQIKELANKNSSGENNLKNKDIDTHDIVSFLIRAKEEQRACQVENNNIFEQLLKIENSLDTERNKNIVLEKKQTELESELKYLQSNKEKMDEELSKTKKSLKKKNEENSNLEKEKTKLKSQLENIQSDKEKTKNELSEIKQTLESKKEKNDILEEEKIALNITLNDKDNELNNIAEELNKLKSFESSIKTLKLMTLLNTLLENSALSTYRKKSAIVDDSSESIYNLLLKLSTGQIFVKSYYETLVGYKKKNQKEMSREEVAFYEAINSFFGEEIIENPSKTKIDGKFDKSKHRGINNEKEGILDNGMVLIPSDTTNNDKIKVKLTLKV